MRRLGLSIFCAVVLVACPPPHDTGDGGTDAGDDAGFDAGVDAGVVVDPPIITPNESGWWRDDVFYEIFVRSFQDSSETGDGIGDLAGLTSRLDYLNDGNADSTNDLGVDGIWLMPIFPAASYHGYDTTDYRTISSDYGTLEEFDALIAAAHARGIKVVLDLVMNHTSTQHPWFQSAQQGPESPYRNYYVWRTSRPTGWNHPFGGGEMWHAANGAYYYGVYWSGMPDLNWKNPEVEAEFLATMRFWLARGVDGFRVDAIRYLVESEDGKLADQPETHEVIQRMRHAIHQEYPQALFLAEAWTSSNKVATYYGEGNEFNLAFAFEVSDSIRNSVKQGTRTAIEQTNNIAATLFPDRGFDAPFLTNHDQNRVKREFSFTSAAGAPVMARLAAAILFAQPGTPFIYYGEELGMMGGSARDEDRRTPFRWNSTAPQYGFTAASNSWYSSLGFTATEEVGVNVETQAADSSSLWTLYRELIALRHTHPALKMGGAATARPTTGGTTIFSLVRTAADGTRVLFVANLANTASGAFTVPVAGNPNVLLAEGLGTPPTVSGSSLNFADMNARSFAFIRLD